MFEYKDAVLLTEDSKNKGEQLDRINYEYLMKVVGDPSLLDDALERYEVYVDMAIKNACLEKNNHVHVKTFTTVNIEALLELFSKYKTSKVEFSSFCRLLDNWFEDSFFTRYTETGYNVESHTKVSYTIKW